MKLGFSVAALAPWRGGRAAMRMGLVSLPPGEWRDERSDPALRREALARPGQAIVLPEAEAAGAEAARMIGVEGGLVEAAAAGWEDLALVTRAGDAHVLSGAAIGFPTGWTLPEKIGLSITEVHAPTQGYADKLALGVERFFDTLPPGKVSGRANFFVVASGDLAYLPEAPPEQLFADVTGENAGERLWVRCERQTFVRLPETGAILFGIGVYRARLDTLAAPLVIDLATAVTKFMPGEDERRGAPQYAQALSNYAGQRGGNDA